MEYALPGCPENLFVVRCVVRVEPIQEYQFLQKKHRARQQDYAYGLWCSVGVGAVSDEQSTPVGHSL